MVNTAKKKTSTKKSSAKTPVVRKKSTAKQPTKVDYYPNRMTVAVSALAATILVLMALIAVLGSHS